MKNNRTLARCFAAALVLIITSSLSATPQILSDFNCSIEIPDNWVVLNPNKPYALIARNGDNTKEIFVAAFKFPPNLSPNNISSAIVDFKNGIKESMLAQKLKISNEQSIVVENVPFASFFAIGANISSLIYITSAGEYYYGILGQEVGPNISQDSEILSILHSFRLLLPVQINPLPRETSKTGSTMGLKMGYFMALFNIPALILIGFLIYYNGSMKKKRAAANSIDS